MNSQEILIRNNPSEFAFLSRRHKHCDAFEVTTKGRSLIPSVSGRLHPAHLHNRNVEEPS